MCAYLGRALRAAVAATTVMFIGSGPAQAAIYVGSWDPPVGFPFTVASGFLTFNLGWSGEVEVFVPDACIPVGGGVVSGNCGGGAVVQSAKVDLYDAGANLASTADDTPRNTLVFTPGLFSINSMKFDSLGDLLELDADNSGAQFDGSSGGTAASFTLKFERDYPYTGPGNEALLYTGPLLLWSRNPCFSAVVGSETVEWCNGLNNFVAYPPIEFAFTRQVAEVPESGSLALIASALFATGFAARKRRRL